LLLILFLLFVFIIIFLFFCHVELRSLKIFLLLFRRMHP